MKTLHRFTSLSDYKCMWDKLYVEPIDNIFEQKATQEIVKAVKANGEDVFDELQSTLKMGAMATFINAQQYLLWHANAKEGGSESDMCKYIAGLLETNLWDQGLLETMECWSEGRFDSDEQELVMHVCGELEENLISGSGQEYLLKTLNRERRYVQQLRKELGMGCRDYVYIHMDTLFDSIDKLGNYYPEYLIHKDEDNAPVFGSPRDGIIPLLTNPPINAFFVHDEEILLPTKVLELPPKAIVEIMEFGE